MNTTKPPTRLTRAGRLAARADPTEERLVQLALDLHDGALQEIADQKGIDAFVGCSGPEGGPPPPPEVDIINISFQPSRIEVRVGDVVTWTQRDNVTHTVTEDDGLFDSGTLPDEGMTFDFTFTESGEYSYHCEIHSSMTGVVTVVR